MQVLDMISSLYKFFPSIINLDYNDKKSDKRSVYQMFHVLIFLFIQICKTY